MKKFILPLLLILFVSTLVAAQSEASDVVGYFKVSVPQNEWVPLAIPFEITNGSPSALFGTNWNSLSDYSEPDMLMNTYTNAQTNYFYEWGWDPDDATFLSPGNWVWANRLQPNANTDVFLMGKVNPQPISLNMNGVDLGSWTPFSSNSAVPLTIQELGFTAADPNADFTDFDTIMCMNDFRSAIYYGEDLGGWFSADGEDFLIEPSYTYYYYSLQPTTWIWNYPVDTRQINGFKRSK